MRPAWVPNCRLYQHVCLFYALAIYKLIDRVRYIDAYTNPNLTTWVDDYKQRLPKNKLIDTC